MSSHLFFNGLRIIFFFCTVGKPFSHIWTQWKMNRWCDNRSARCRLMIISNSWTYWSIEKRWHAVTIVNGQGSIHHTSALVVVVVVVVVITIMERICVNVDQEKELDHLSFSISLRTRSVSSSSFSSIGTEIWARHLIADVTFLLAIDVSCCVMIDWQADRFVAGQLTFDQNQITQEKENEEANRWWWTRADFNCSPINQVKGNCC